MAKPYPLPKDAKLSVIIPAYNAEAWIGPTLQYLWDSLSKTTWKSIEIIVVDDGSKDKTAQAAADAGIAHKVEVIRQPNAGRFKARKTGLDAASGDYVFFIDSRTFTKPGSFPYLVKQMQKNPDAVVWNGHVEIERRGNAQARFWHAVTFLAWRDYLAHPRLLHYNIDNFDKYPKGTTCFFAPREVLLRAYKQFTTTYADMHYANDDSSLIRYIARELDIYLSPDFCFTYNSRTSMKAFIKHTLHRGVVFVDGYFHKGTRYYYPLWLYYLLVPITIVACIFRPIGLVLIVPALVLIWLLGVAFRVPWRDMTALVCLLPIFAIMYTIGLYKGLYLRWQHKQA